MKARATHAPVSLDAVFGALADPTRRAIIEQLVRGPCPIGQISEPFNISAPAISKHLRVLEQSGLITRTKAGRITYCQLTRRPFADAGRWLSEHEAFWQERFDALADYLEEGEWPPPSPEQAPSRSGSHAVSTPRATASSRRGRRRKP